MLFIVYFSTRLNTLLTYSPTLTLLLYYPSTLLPSYPPTLLPFYPPILLPYYPTGYGSVSLLWFSTLSTPSSSSVLNPRSSLSPSISSSSPNFSLLFTPLPTPPLTVPTCCGDEGGG